MTDRLGDMADIAMPAAVDKAMDVAACRKVLMSLSICSVEGVREALNKGALMAQQG